MDPANIPIEQQVCACGHWYEEHDDGGFCEGCRINDRRVECCHEFVFDPDENTPEAITDRGGEPALWPDHVKAAVPNWRDYADSAFLEENR